MAGLAFSVFARAAVMAMKRSEFKKQIRSEAKRVVQGSRFSQTPKGIKDYGEAVEQGRRQLLIKSNEGGDSAGKRIKAELLYLLNNYLPQYDTRIEALIDAWRTSHDPEYDPAIRTRLRRARQDHMRKSNPF
jgi:hypothetical protein